MATITFIDYGNRALVHVTKLASLPAQFSTAVLPAQANEYQLALVKPPSDEVDLCFARNSTKLALLGLLLDRSQRIHLNARVSRSILDQRREPPRRIHFPGLKTD